MQKKLLSTQIDIDSYVYIYYMFNRNYLKKRKKKILKLFAFCNRINKLFHVIDAIKFNQQQKII